LLGDGLKGLWNPDEQNLANCVDFGRAFCRQVK